jgi:hypothetical protein
MGLAALGGALLLGSGMTTPRASRVARASGWLTWGILLLSGLRFYSKILRRDALVLTVAPSLLFLRAWALGLGFLLGNLRFILWQGVKFHGDRF